MMAAAYRLAWTEARRGDENAIYFLDCVLPSWREWEQRRQKRAIENDSKLRGGKYGRRKRNSPSQGRAGRESRGQVLHAG